MKIAICDDDNLHFNPRSHVGNDLVYCCRCGNHLNFNPRSHVGNDAGSVSILRRNIISIHVPTWGTTNSGTLSAVCCFISIHVPTWGTTVHYIIKGSEHGNFNPRSHVGNDGAIVPIRQRELAFQSTFPRGERRCCVCEAIAVVNFNPRSHVGNDFYRTS